MQEISAFHSEMFLGSRQGMLCALAFDVVERDVPEGVTAAERVGVDPDIGSNLTGNGATVTNRKRDAMIGVAGNDKNGRVNFSGADVKCNNIAIGNF